MICCAAAVASCYYKLKAMRYDTACKYLLIGLPHDIILKIEQNRFKVDGESSTGMHGSAVSVTLTSEPVTFSMSSMLCAHAAD